MLAARHGKPLLHIREMTTFPGQRLAELITSHGVACLNVAGPTTAAARGLVLQTLDEAAACLLAKAEARP
jgi:hypothetical protein